MPPIILLAAALLPAVDPPTHLLLPPRPPPAEAPAAIPAEAAPAPPPPPVIRIDPARYVVEPPEVVPAPAPPPSAPGGCACGADDCPCTGPCQCRVVDGHCTKCQVPAPAGLLKQGPPRPEDSVWINVTGYPEVQVLGLIVDGTIRPAGPWLQMRRRPPARAVAPPAPVTPPLPAYPAPQPPYAPPAASYAAPSYGVSSCGPGGCSTQSAPGLFRLFRRAR